MSEPTFTASMERLLDDTRAALERMHPNAAGARVADGPENSDADTAAPLRSEASDRSARATAVVVTPGRIESLRIDPRLMREGSEAVCVAIIEASNAAFAQLQDDAISGAVDIDTAGLVVDLERLQADSLTSATTMMASLQDAMARIAAPVERTRS